MNKPLYRLSKQEEFRKAGPLDLIEVAGAPHQHPLYIPKLVLEEFVTAVMNNEFCHISGPTGTAKTAMIEALNLEPENWRALCAALGYPVKPLKLYPIPMPVFETPGELLVRRALSNGSTLDEKSVLVRSVEDALRHRATHVTVIWCKELGRVHSTSVQGGLLDLITKGDIILPDGSRLDGSSIAWIADSNYQAEADATHTLVVLDVAVKRRFTVNITMNYLSAEQEGMVLREIVRKLKPRGFQKTDDELIEKVVKLGHAVRRQHEEGNLQSAPPPTISGYLAFLRLSVALRHLSLQQIAMATLLGHCSREDSKQAAAVLNEVFGLQVLDAEDPAMGVNLF